MRTHDATQVRTGLDVYGADGEKIGAVTDVSTNYFVIEKGFLFTTDLFVPTSAVAAVQDDRVELNLTKEQIEEGNFSSPIGDGGSDVLSEPATTSSDGAAHGDLGDRDVIERSEERLTVDKDVEQTGRVRVGKRVLEEQQSVDVPVEREEVHLERRSVDRPTGSGNFTDESIDVPIYEERARATKDARVIEELNLNKTAYTDTERVEETVRREEFDIDDSRGDESTP